MEARSTLDNTIALVRTHPHENSLAKALELCQRAQRRLERNSDPTVTANIPSRNRSLNLIQRYSSKGKDDGIQRY